MDETRDPLLAEDEVKDLVDDDRDAGWEEDEAYDWAR